MEYIVNCKSLKAYCKEILMALNLKEADAEIAADSLVTADLRGVYSHGVNQLTNYLNRLMAGGADPGADIAIVRESPVTAVLDAKHALGAVSSIKAVKLAREKARENGIAYVTVRNGSHFGMAAYWSLMLSEGGMIGFAASDTDPMMAAFGGSKAMVGNNPFSCAFSGRRYPRICLDMACSVVAGSKLGKLIALGETMPEGWFLTADGRHTTDPAQGVTALPFGGHKGSGLSFMIEVLTSQLAGGSFGPEMGNFLLNPPGEYILTSHSFAAIRIDAFRDLPEFQTSVDNYVDYLKSSPRMDGVEEILYPGELEFRNETRYREEGVPIEEHLLDKLIDAGKKVGLEASSWNFLKQRTREGS